MDKSRFDDWVIRFSQTRSRRRTLSGLILSAVGLARASDGVVAGPCKNVGKKCKKAKECCSGICKGKKGKKKCKAHDVSTCLPGQSLPSCGGTEKVICTTTTGDEGICVTTTGNAGYCAADIECFPCTRDADCQAICGPQAACVPCGPDCADEGGTACVGVNSGDCNPPT